VSLRRPGLEELVGSWAWEQSKHRRRSPDGV
jgi:hypothetical protein